MLGYMFWAAECPGTRQVCTTPPNTCENGVGAGAKYFFEDKGVSITSITGLRQK
jgi:hypothetical protein